MIVSFSLPWGPRALCLRPPPRVRFPWAGHRRARKPLSAAVVRERSDTVPREPEALRRRDRRWAPGRRGGGCRVCRPAQTARIRGGDAGFGTIGSEAREIIADEGSHPPQDMACRRPIGCRFQRPTSMA
jgi:hypothetical protein